MSEDEARSGVFVRGVPGAGKSTAIWRLTVVVDEMASIEMASIPSIPAGVFDRLPTLTALNRMNAGEGTTDE